MTASEVFEIVSDMLKDRYRTYHKPEDLLRYLNTAAQEICNRSQSVRSGIYHSVVKGQTHYGLHPDFLGVDFVGFCQKNSRRFNPLSRSTLRESTVLNQNRGSYGSFYQIPAYYDVWGRTSRERMVGLIQSGGDDFFYMENVSPGVKVGDRVINVTDGGSGGVIESIKQCVATKVCIGGELRGGKTNTFSIDDQVRILSPSRSLHTLIISPPSYFDDDAGTESLFVYVKHKHRVITQADVDVENDELEVDAELETAFIHLVAYWGSLADRGIEDDMTQLFRVGYEREYLKQIGRVRSRFSEFKSSWFSGNAYVDRVYAFSHVGGNDSTQASGNDFDLN